jgi:hypothetical protein
LKFGCFSSKSDQPPLIRRSPRAKIYRRLGLTGEFNYDLTRFKALAEPGFFTTGLDVERPTGAGSGSNKFS